MNHPFFPRRLLRSLSIGVLFSLLFFFFIHVLGKWRVDNYRPDPDTTSTVLLYNHCLIFDKGHILRPNTVVPTMEHGINGTKLAGSFMLFYEGHVSALLLTALLTGAIIFLVWNLIKKKSIE